MTNLEIIRKACVAANPDKDWQVGERTDAMWEEKVRLADVLLAIRHAPNGIAECHGEDGDILVCRPSVGNPFTWNLRTDDLEQQSEETLTFLAYLLK